MVPVPSPSPPPPPITVWSPAVAHGTPVCAVTGALCFHATSEHHESPRLWLSSTAVLPVACDQCGGTPTPLAPELVPGFGLLCCAWCGHHASTEPVALGASGTLRCRHCTTGYYWVAAVFASAVEARVLEWLAAGTSCMQAARGRALAAEAGALLQVWVDALRRRVFSLYTLLFDDQCPLACTNPDMRRWLGAAAWSTLTGRLVTVAQFAADLEPSLAAEYAATSSGRLTGDCGFCASRGRHRMQWRFCANYAAHERRVLACRPFTRCAANQLVCIECRQRQL